LIERTLVMEFKDAFGKKHSLSVKDVKEDLNEAEISALMDEILSSGLIQTENGALVEKVSANVITKETTELAI